MTNKTAFLKASENVVADLDKVAYEGQPAHMRMFKAGFEHFINEIPVFDPGGDTKYDTEQKEFLTGFVLQHLSEKVRNENWVKDLIPGKKEFKRVVLAMESPSVNSGGELTQGAEVVLAIWGKGFSSPVHGHSPGYTHEQILFGKILLNKYQMANENGGIVRLVDSLIVTEGTFTSKYLQYNADHKFKRQNLIHSLTSIEESASVHYVPEHSRDGRDNSFTVEYFEDFYDFTPDDFTRLTAKDGLYLRNGDVALVRSENVPGYGDHYIIITGRPVMKPYGLRPQEKVIIAPNTGEILDQYEKQLGLILLKLNNQAKVAFHLFHNIIMENGEVVMPEN